mgnify:CR=1 FL=1
MAHGLPDGVEGVRAAGEVDEDAGGALDALAGRPGPQLLLETAVASQRVRTASGRTRPERTCGITLARLSNSIAMPPVNCFTILSLRAWTCPMSMVTGPPPKLIVMLPSGFCLAVTLL